MAKRSRLWYAIPILFGLPASFGFFIAWKVGFILKKDTSDFPLKFLILGAVVSGITWTLQIIEFSLAQRDIIYNAPDIIIDTSPVLSLIGG
jgi:hypothetical protein